MSPGISNDSLINLRRNLRDWSVTVLQRGPQFLRKSIVEIIRILWIHHIFILRDVPVEKIPSAFTAGFRRLVK